MLLSPLGWLYGKIADIRNALYDRGTLRSYSLGAKTISVGNITAGGTGKTPLVAYVAEILADAGENVCILTRGYGRKSSGRVLVSDGERLLVDARTGGDEPVELAQKLIGKAIVVADANRVSAAAWAKQNFGVTAFVLDDGFQHRRAKRSLDIVCVDATNPWGKMIPAGLLREPLANLARGDAIVLTRCDLVDGVPVLLSWAATLNSAAQIFESHSEVVEVSNLRTFANSPRPRTDRGADIPALAFCGLANPDGFFGSLRRADFRIEATRSFPDHHYYTQADVDEIERYARECGIGILLTTGKDAVKLIDLKFDLACYVIGAEVKLNDPDGFRELVLSA